MSIDKVTTIQDLRETIGQWRLQGEVVGFIPTMGALHEGHLSLVREAFEECDRVVVSIFVNPAQFGPNEDLDTYPRTEELDSKKLESIGADLIYLPDTSEIYPEGFQTTVHVNEITKSLCGLSRPGHFDGVTTIVMKLFMQVLPDYAFFGEKDYQQLCTIKQMVKDLDIPINIIGVPIVRDDEGLALSSRNAYLSPEEKKIALQLNKTLFSMADKLKSAPKKVIKVKEWGLKQLEEAGFNKVEYLDIRDSETLENVTNLEYPARILAAVHIGGTRLIDNIGLGN